MRKARIHNLGFKKRNRPTKRRLDGPGAQLNGFVCLRSQIKIVVGQAAGIVSYQRQANLVVADINVRMMSCAFGQLAAAIAESWRGAKFFEADGGSRFA